MEKVKVLIVDDSAVVRQVLKRELEKSENIEVIGTAPDPYIARDIMVRNRPDVITLDIEMPRMDGLTFLKKVMKYMPLPVIIVSSITQKGSQASIRAMELGAIDVVPKPSSAFSVDELGPVLREKVIAAKYANVRRRVDITKISKINTNLAGIELSNKVIAIGASTGGTEAIKLVLSSLPSNLPGIVIVQHMPPGFTKSFAESLNNITEIEVKEASDGDSVIPGKAYVAPGNYHMILKRSGARFSVGIKTGPRVHFQRPAVDVLFDSVAQIAGKNAIGILLTGMGKDGAKGLLNMKNNGARTIAQDKDSCVVFGMPREAIEMGAAEFVLPLNKIPQKIIELVEK